MHRVANCLYTVLAPISRVCNTVSEDLDGVVRVDPPLGLLFTCMDGAVDGGSALVVIEGWCKGE